VLLESFSNSLTVQVAICCDSVHTLLLSSVFYRFLSALFLMRELGIDTASEESLTRQG